MLAIILMIVACFVASCVSAPRAREAHCLAVTTLDTWQAQNDLESAEQTWRAAQQARFERSLGHRDSSRSSDGIVHSHASLGTVTPVSARGDGAPLSEVDEERTLYQRVVATQARYGETSKWFGRVAHRVQTRFEEDDLLFPVLGMLATSPGILLYPVVRWNVRSALWDGEDPDAENDPVQIFCAARLRQDTLGPAP